MFTISIVPPSSNRYGHFIMQTGCRRSKNPK